MMPFDLGKVYIDIPYECIENINYIKSIYLYITRHDNLHAWHGHLKYTVRTVYVKNYKIRLGSVIEGSGFLIGGEIFVQF